MHVRTGVVYLVGSGAGDPGLLTVRAAEVLAAADCVVYDYLVNPQILNRVPARAERLFVGKKAGARVMDQPSIDALLCDRADQGLVVVRLKGGDPTFFARGSEELRALKAQGTPFEIVPGITSGIAAPAYAGIPVTDRAHASSVCFITGTEQPGAESRHDWPALAKAGTLVLYMAVKALPAIVPELLAAGRPADEPCAVIRWGTWAHQEVRRCTLGSLIDTVEGMSPPAIVLIGPVCHESFPWFQPGPLAGRTLLVAGAEPGGPLARALVDAGARVLEGPGERVEGAADASALDEALAQLDRYRWIAFTSRSAVRHTLGRLCRGGRDLRALAACRLAAIGPSCAEELAAWNLVPDCTPERHDSRHLAETMAADDGTARGLVLHPGSEGANHPLGAALADFGYDCERVAAYRSLSRTTAMRLTEEQVDGVCLASPSSARRYAKGVDSADRSRMEAGPCPFYAIGDPTAATMRQLGLPEARIAPGQDLDSLVALIVAELG